MSAKLLITSLKTQDVNLNLLLDSLEQQKEAIIKNDFAQLENSINSEQVILRNIENEESTRVKVVRDIEKQFNLKLTDHTLEELLSKGGNIFNGEAKELVTLKKSLKEKAVKIKQLNTQLKDVIEFSRNLIKETMMIVAAKNKQALVNKRV